MKLGRSAVVPLVLLLGVHLGWVASVAASVEVARPKSALLCEVLLTRDLQGAPAQEAASTHFMNINISAQGAAPGSVVASTSGHYWFHWVRDAALVMRHMVRLYANAEEDSVTKANYKLQIEAYLQFTRMTQLRASEAPGGLFQEKYLVDGTPDNSVTEHNQKDGPATVLVVIAEYIEALRAEGHSDLELRERFLLDPSMTAGLDPSNVGFVFGTYLEALRDKWTDPTSDVWEETSGKSHFYTLFTFREAFRAVQRVELALGRSTERTSADIAALLQDGASVRAIDQLLAVLPVPGDDEYGVVHHWWSAGGFFAPTIDPVGWMKERKTGADGSTLVGLVYFGKPEEYLSARSFSNAGVLMETARKLFPNINGSDPEGAVAVTRYLGDLWNGFKRANHADSHPWTLITAAMGELHYKFFSAMMQRKFFRLDKMMTPFLRGLLPQTTLDELEVKGTLLLRKSDAQFEPFAAAVLRRADAYHSLILKYAGPNGELAEQMNRNELGVQQGPKNLSWSHLAYLRMRDAEKTALELARAFRSKPPPAAVAHP